MKTGLSGIIIAANNHLLSDSCTEITISSLEIGDARRSDRLLGLSLIIILFVISVLVKFNSILRTQFHVFISYSREDKEQAGALASRLNDYGLSVWLDSIKLVPGHHYPVSIATGIRNCHYFVLLASPNSRDSQFVGIEIGMRIKRANICIFGWEIRLPWARLATQNAIVVILDGDPSNVPSVFSTVERVNCGAWDPEKIAAEVAKLIYLGHPPKKTIAPTDMTPDQTEEI